MFLFRAMQKLKPSMQNGHFQVSGFLAAAIACLLPVAASHAADLLVSPSGSPTVTVPIQVAGGACQVNGATGTDSSGNTLQCQGGQWRRSVIFLHTTISSGSNCSNVPVGSFAFDNTNKLYVCK